jgi:hypothetical protein
MYLPQEWLIAGSALASSAPMVSRLNINLKVIDKDQKFSSGTNLSKT